MIHGKQGIATWFIDAENDTLDFKFKNTLLGHAKEQA